MCPKAVDGSAKSGFQPGMGMGHRKIHAGNAQSKLRCQSERAGLVGLYRVPRIVPCYPLSRHQSFFEAVQPYGIGRFHGTVQIR